MSRLQITKALSYFSHMRSQIAQRRNNKNTREKFSLN